MSSTLILRTSLPACLLGGLLIASDANAQIASPSVATWASGNNVVSLAPGSSLSIPAFKTEIESAFTAGLGGTIAFDDYGPNGNAASLIVSSYNGGRSTLTITTSGTLGTVNTGFTPGTSSGTTVLGFNNDASTRTFTFSTPLSVFGLVGTYTSPRTSTVLFTLSDNSTVSVTDTISSTSDNTLFNYKAPAGKSIVSATISMPDGFVRFDDFAFVIAAAKPAQQAFPPSSVPLYRWSFETGGMPEVKIPDRIRGGQLIAVSGNIDELPVLQRRTGGVSSASPGVLNASHTFYGNLDGSQVSSMGSNLFTGAALEQFTITLWIKASLPPEMQPEARLINIGPADSEQGKNSVLIAFEAPGFSVRVNNSHYFRAEVKEPVVQANEWVFLAFAYDGLTDNAHYSPGMVDRFQSQNNGAILAGGLNQAVRPVSALAISTGAPTYVVPPGKIHLDGLQVAIGSSNVLFDRSFVGWIDDVRIYSGLLTMPELDRVRLEAIRK